ncbi:hypothetical protein EU546_02070 [Candidatus Thorarchaeota archaeon]|nr:MAG: hypothetical protein EU546_02070 [Candidatus Thorarchaeota archaeon]
MGEVLGLLGFNWDEKKTSVLRAVLRLHEKPDSSMAFKDIRQQLEIEEGGHKGDDALIYSILSVLEEEGFIKVDRSAYVHNYKSGAASIARGLETLREQAIDALMRKHDLLKSESERVASLDPVDLTNQVIDAVRGETKREKPVFVQGLDEILKLVDSKVYGSLREGDTIRITLDWLNYRLGMERDRLRSIRGVLKRGVRIKALVSPELDEMRLQRYAQLILETQSKGLDGDMRLRNRSDATYQFVARNSEGIVLIVSESPFSATWMPAESHPDLVKNAIESFDLDFDSGQSIVERSTGRPEAK